MKITTLAVSILAALGAGCATEIPLRAPALALTELPDCYSANYDAQLDLFTLRNAGPLLVNQQCLLSVGPGAGVSASRLKAGRYTIHVSNGGGGGAGGNACVFAPFYIPGGPGWLGSPSNMVRVDSGEVIAGTIGAENYVRPTHAQNEKLAGKMDGHGGSGPGQTRGAHGGRAESAMPAPRAVTASSPCARVDST